VFKKKGGEKAFGLLGAEDLPVGNTNGKTRDPVVRLQRGSVFKWTGLLRVPNSLAFPKRELVCESVVLPQGLAFASVPFPAVSRPGFSLRWP